MSTFDHVHAHDAECGDLGEYTLQKPQNPGHPEVNENAGNEEGHAVEQLQQLQDDPSRSPSNYPGLIRKPGAVRRF